MPRASRKRSCQVQSPCVNDGFSDEEAAKQLTRRDSASESDIYDQQAEEATGDEDIAESDSTSNGQSVGPARSRPRKNNPTKRSGQRKAPSRAHGSPAKKQDKRATALKKTSQAARIKPITLHESRKAPQDKEGMLSALLGTHVPLAIASARSKLWSKQLNGPQSSFIAANCEYIEPEAISEAFDRGSFSLSTITNSSIYELYLPRRPNLSVHFRSAETLDELTTDMVSAAAQTTSFANNGARSLTIYTGISNQTIDWLKTKDKKQTLAIGGKMHDEEPTPLFRFQSGPGVVQIWEISAGPNRNAQSKIIYVHDYGATWQLKWCPAVSPNSRLIGWLAGVFGDGVTRLWPVDESSKASRSPDIRRILRPAYEFRVPETQCVKLDWITETRIAIGCANGMYIIWDPLHKNALPFTVGHPHSSYINNIVTCAPSAPDTVLTSSWDCDITFSRLQQWDTECLSAARERMPVYAIAWSDFLNSAVMNEDLRGVRTVAMRTGNAFSIATMTGTVTALGTHATHPFLAIGDASGAVLVVNLCRKSLWKKHDQYQRKVYQLECGNAMNTYQITEHYQVGELLSKTGAATAGVTNIYPNELCIKDLVWNGNAGFEALLASCSANFVRIDDLTITG